MRKPTANLRIRTSLVSWAIVIKSPDNTRPAPYRRSIRIDKPQVSSARRSSGIPVLSNCVIES
jgi:hypothetical protein